MQHMPSYICMLILLGLVQCGHDNVYIDVSPPDTIMIRNSFVLPRIRLSMPFYILPDLLRA